MTLDSATTPKEAMRALRADRHARGFRRVQVDKLPTEVHQALVSYANRNNIFLRDAAGLLIEEALRQKGILAMTG